MTASRSLILGTAGHIDHGKTALVRALTGTDTDRLPEEKSRGITIDIGFAHLDLATPAGAARIGIVDVPGHERFIRNMLAGASGMDIAMLVVAADDSIMPQTREHLAILRFLGVRTGVIALTKCDRGEDDWLDLVEEDVRRLVSGSFLADAEIVRTSAITGDGIAALREAIGRAVAAHPAPSSHRPFRLAVDRAFVKEGLGTVVTGTVASGSVAPGDSLQWHALQASEPQTVSVRGVQSHGVAVERVGSGARAALVLAGVHHEAIARGHELAAPGYLAPSNWLTVSLHVLQESPWPVRHRARIRLHLGTAEVHARVALLEGTAIEPGMSDVVQLVTAQPVPAVAGQPFVVRAESPVLTLGGGQVLEPTALRRTRRDAAGRAEVRALADADARARVLAAVDRRATREFEALDLARETGLEPGAAVELIDDLVSDGAIVTLIVPPKRTLRLATRVRDVIEERVLRAVRAAHDAAPGESRIARSAVTRRLRIDSCVVEGMLDRLVTAGRLAGDDRGVADEACMPKVTDRQQLLARHLATTFEAAAFGPPDPTEVAIESGAVGRDVRPAIEVCLGRGDLVHIGGGAYLHGRWETELRHRTQEALSQTDGLTMSELRTLLETSRKHAVPIGEYLDRIGLTRRIGDRRVLREH